MSLKEEIYLLYKQEWLKRVPEEEKIKKYQEWLKITDDSISFNDYVEKTGYKEGLYPSYNKFIDYEFQDEKIILPLISFSNRLKEGYERERAA